MTNRADGSNYAPEGRPQPVCKPGDFRIAAVGLDHGHIFGMCRGLVEAGAELTWVYDPDPDKMKSILDAFPGSRPALSEEQVLNDPSVQLIASSRIPADRAAFGMRVMQHDKDYFVDKAPLTTLEQLDQVRKTVVQTGRKYAVYYSERLHVESAVYAGRLVQAGEIGKVVQVMGMGPHRLNPRSRPEWFFHRELYGGILCDIGSHQLEQFLYYTGAEDATITASRVDNFAHPEYPDFEDFGDVNVIGGNGASGYFRVDWFTPDGLGTWGDGRMFILGTDGYIEMRKYTDVAREDVGDHVYLVNHSGEYHIPVHGRVGYPFFGELILDCLNRTEYAMTQEHALKAAELAVRAQNLAVKGKEAAQA
ncbi:putative dehydrogenase [Alicyclobacillus sacchari]|uniref:Putative dehydrogenase n=1 Tax=Alicyclobacillus sacchari TaxID=392010 RepID=A0A4R8LS05_9BACL|nr:Gfo/Idh/MocA family oxidoreductase [Alicyclobacillus sacchari]TDY49525.1 putative dehydrogenase [Alicyclobacillus sacchari]GMA58627.1 oxidoreductase [Alicyclobacillus sacchari]